MDKYPSLPFLSFPSDQNSKNHMTQPQAISLAAFSVTEETK